MSKYRGFLRACCIPVLLALCLVGQGLVQALPGGQAARFPGGTEPAAAPASTWQVEPVDLAKSFSLMSTRSLALDGADHPHIAYGGNGLYYAYHDGSNWNLETVDRTPGLGQYAAIGVDAAGHPHLSYYDEVNSDLRYAYHDGTDWQVVVVDTGAGSC